MKWKNGPRGQTGDYKLSAFNSNPTSNILLLSEDDQEVIVEYVGWNSRL